MRKSDNKRPGPGGRGSFKATKGGKPGSDRPFGDKPKKRDGKAFSDKKEKPGDFKGKPRRNFSEDKGDRPRGFKFDDKPRRSSEGSEKPESFRRNDRYKKSGADEKPRRSFGDKRESEDRPRKRSEDLDKQGDFRRNDRYKKSNADEKPRRSAGDQRDFGDKPRKRSEGLDEKPRRSFGSKAGRNTGDRNDRKRHNKGEESGENIKRVKFGDFEDGKVFSGSPKHDGRKKKPGKKPVAKQPSDDGKIRLNKYLSNAGVASRREADTLIQSGVVKVNGVVVDQLGYKINPGDKVTYGDAAVKSERKVYLLLNKPKDYITTVDDPQERKTVMELIAGACRERVYPVGRLDRNTTGLLLFTNDGELTTKLTHPKFRIKKVYHVSLNKGLKPDDFNAIMEGIELEDGPIKADDLAFVGEGKKEIGIEVHSGRNRIVRRMFEQLGYDVLKLDRVTFAGLTKKDLPRGKYRFLTAKEIGFLQMIG